MGLYKFSADDARRFAREQGARVRQRGDELVFSECPYCHNKKDKEKFSINLLTGQFSCKRAKCGARGNMLTLHKDFGFDLGTDLREYERPYYTWRQFKKPEKIEPTPQAMEYLLNRKISEDVIKRYQITTKKDQENILVFPFFNENGDMEYIKYRKTDFDKEKDKNKEWCEKDCRAILFGMGQCTDSKRLIITEGQIDSLSVATAGIENAVSVPTGKNGMTWIPHCWEWLKRFDEIVVFGDYENGAMTLLPEIRERFDCKISAVRPADYHGCKDANELLQKYGVEAVRAAVENAQPQLPQTVEGMWNVRYENERKEILPTGITQIDKLLKGGLQFGYLHILTGKRGEGKSTWGSMLTMRALDYGVNTFIYSGEMTKGDVKRWLDFQIAGSKRVYAERSGEYEMYRLSNSNIDRINAWYTDRSYIYNASAVREQKVDLIALIEKQIVQFACRFILVDNLMTAIDMINADGNKYERQEMLCKRLADIAQRYNVMIVLIAHKKKTDPRFNTDENDDVLGSSEITNLAGIIMSYGRSSDIDEDQRIIKITKNRVDGFCNFDGFITNYHPASKRIYGIGDPEDFECSCWEDFLPMQDEMEIPF